MFEKKTYSLECEPISKSIVINDDLLLVQQWGCSISLTRECRTFFGHSMAFYSNKKMRMDLLICPWAFLLRTDHGAQTIARTSSVMA
jgi:hypothetical protein